MIKLNSSTNPKMSTISVHYQIESKTNISTLHTIWNWFLIQNPQPISVPSSNWTQNLHPYFTKSETKYGQLKDGISGSSFKSPNTLNNLIIIDLQEVYRFLDTSHRLAQSFSRSNTQNPSHMKWKINRDSYLGALPRNPSSCSYSWL